MDESSRQGTTRDEEPGEGRPGVLASILDFLRFVVSSKACTTNLMWIFAGTTLCLLAMIVVVAYAAPDLKTLFALAAGLSGTATVSVQLKATWERRRWAPGSGRGA